MALRIFFAAHYTDHQAAAELGRTPRAIAIERSKLGLVAWTNSRGSAVRDMSDYTLIRELRRRGFAVHQRLDMKAVETGSRRSPVNARNTTPEPDTYDEALVLAAYIEALRSSDEVEQARLREEFAEYPELLRRIAALLRAQTILAVRSR